MKKGYSKWEVTDHLKTKAQMRRYLNAALADYGDDPAFIVTVLRDIARARTMNQLAKDAGLSRSGLYKALSGDGKPEFVTIMKIMHALGVELRMA